LVGLLTRETSIMADSAQFRWGRIVLAIIAAETLPILLLLLVVVVYSAIRPAGSRSPEEFAPLAGNWVGPIGGFLATLLFAWWAARRAPRRQLVHGAAVGVGTSVLDFSLGILLGGGGAIATVFFLSNAGRIIAGVLGGWLAARSSPPVA
jgi:hypothetical protein